MQVECGMVVGEDEPRDAPVVVEGKFVDIEGVH
jgi:hypothetical protein